MGYSSDNLPHVGPVPKKPGQFIVAGFSGHGMPQAFLSARGVASMIVEGKQFQQTGLPRLYQTSQERLNSKRNIVLEAWEEAQKAAQPKL